MVSRSRQGVRRSDIREVHLDHVDVLLDKVDNEGRQIQDGG